jgi:hypothetical protein
LEALEQIADASPGGFHASLVGLAQECFELCEDLLDRVEVWAVVLSLAPGETVI